MCPTSSPFPPPPHTHTPTPTPTHTHPQEYMSLYNAELAVVSQRGKEERRGEERWFSNWRTAVKKVKELHTRMTYLYWPIHTHILVYKVDRPIV